jgi:hypothetical protein
MAGFLVIIIDHMLVLVKSAQQRLACFLLEMSDRLAATRKSRSIEPRQMTLC